MNKFLAMFLTATSMFLSTNVYAWHHEAKNDANMEQMLDKHKSVNKNYAQSDHPMKDHMENKKAEMHEKMKHKVQKQCNHDCQKKVHGAESKYKRAKAVNKMLLD